MIIHFPKQLVTDEVYNTIKDRYIENIIYYIINSKYRISVNLKSWIRQQVDNPTPELLKFCESIETNSDTDEQMLQILRYVHNNIRYVGDVNNWSMDEYWQTASETIQSLSGDCEDGAILIYVLARLKGVNANRLHVMTGDVNGGGHCWVGYKPNGYPKDYVFLDWCYWYNLSTIDYRNKFYIEGSTIYEHSYDDEMIALTTSNYYTIWFAFNEYNSYKKLSYTI